MDSIKTYRVVDEDNNAILELKVDYLAEFGRTHDVPPGVFVVGKTFFPDSRELGEKVSKAIEKDLAQKISAAR